MAKPTILVDDFSEILNEAFGQMVSTPGLVTDSNGVAPGEEGYIETLGDVPINTINTETLTAYGQAYADFKDDTTKAMKFREELINVVTRQIFVMKTYEKIGIDITRSYEGARGIIQKIRVPLQWYAIKNVNQYNDPKPSNTAFRDFNATANYFYKPVSKKLKITISDSVFEGLFLSRENVAKFIATIQKSVDNQLSIHLDSLTMAIINTMTGITLKSGKKTQNWNLLQMYYDETGTVLTPEAALRDGEFHRFAKSEIERIVGIMGRPSALFNQKGTVQQTIRSQAYFWMLRPFHAKNGEYLLSEKFNKEYLEIDGFKLIDAWQGIGEDGSWSEVSKIDIETVLPGDSTPTTVTQENIIAVVCSEDAVAITDVDERTTSKYEPEDEYTVYWPKHKCMPLMDLDENYVVFYMDTVTEVSQ